MRMVIEMPIEVKQEIGTWKGKFIIGEYDLIDAIKTIVSAGVVPTLMY